MERITYKSFIESDYAANQLKFPVKDSEEVGPKLLQTDPSLGQYRAEQEYFDKALPSHLSQTRKVYIVRQHT